MLNQKSLFQKLENRLQSHRDFVVLAFAWAAYFFALAYAMILGSSIIWDGFTWLHIIQIPVMVTAIYFAARQLIKEEAEILRSFVIYFLVAIGAGKWVLAVLAVFVTLALFLRDFLARKKQSAS